MKIKIFISLVLICLLFSSCNSSYSSMLQDFNNNFTQTYYGKESMKFGDLEFEESLMIPKEKYFIFHECSIGFSAPMGAVTYKWKLEKYKEKNILSAQNERNFMYSFGERYVLGVPYILTLEAWDKDGTQFSDTAEIILYEDIKDISL